MIFSGKKLMFIECMNHEFILQQPAHRDRPHFQEVIIGNDKFVRVEGYSDSDLDLQDIIDRLNTNKNKKRRFKPRAPTSRNIKQRLTWIVNNITQTILDKTNP